MPAGKVSFDFIFWISFSLCQISLFTLLIHGSISCTQQATHLRAAAHHHDACEDDGGVHATHLEAHQHALPAAHASRPDVHPRPAGPRAGLPGCHQAQAGAAAQL